jgi:radical SAM protein with 4Fe4S-binding SPASM domain
MNPKKIIPINKGNYSMDTKERDSEYEKKLSSGWEEGYRDYRNKWIDFAKKQIISEYPLLVDIELSSICNLKCPMCYTISDKFGQKVNTKRMDMDLFKKIIDEIAHKVPAIRLSLRGESTLHKNFVECIEYAKANGIKEVSTLTHGFKLTIPFFEKITKAGIDWITISIDGTDEVYESIRKPLKFQDLLQKIKDIKKYKDENNLKKPVIKVQGIWPAVKKNTNKFYDTFAPIVDKVAFNPLIDYLWNDNEIEYLEDFSCPQQYQRLVIGADGLVMKCSNDEENVETVGDATKQTVHEIWHGEKMTKVREMHKEVRGFLKSEICRKCYLPRKTSEEVTKVKDRKLIVRNYTKRSQIVGT